MSGLFDMPEGWFDMPEGCENGPGCCTPKPEPEPVTLDPEALVQWHTETEDGTPVSELVVRDLQRRLGHLVPSDIAVALLRHRLTHSYPQGFR